LFPRKFALFGLLVAGVFTTACRQDMHNQPRYKPYAATDFFGDGRSARPAIADTVARGQLRIDEPRFTGKENGKEITKADIERGHQRFDIYCTPCHGRLGDGNGMIVSRGLRQPPSYNSDRLRNAPIGHFFDVMTNGYGAMYSYASRVAVDDRWRIAAYIKALQESQDPNPQEAAQAAAAAAAATPQNGTAPGGQQ
jgi:mono/diheme cytochrome c family protein